MKRSLVVASLMALLAGAAPAALAQFAPPQPTPEQLSKAFAEDQLSDEKCGIPRNAADEYRPTPASPDQTRAARLSGRQAFKLDAVASGLSHPFALGFLPNGKMLVTIRAGGLRVIDKTGKVSDPLSGVPAVDNTIRVAGMTDLALDRNFKKNRTLYLAYTTKAEAGPGTIGRIISAKLDAEETGLTDIKVLKEGAMLPRRILQGKDGTLLILTADILPGYRFAQDIASPQGKVLRINTDGSIPKDNPFVGTANADPSIYAIGIRDAQGIAFHPKTGEPWIIENHPRGGDELNVIRPGKNYGFPLISYGRDNNGELLNGGKTAQEGLEQPVYFWTPSVAFSGMNIYSGKTLKGWSGSYFMGGLSGKQLVRLELKDGRVTGEEKLLRDQCKRIRDVRQGPDGNLYLLPDEDNGEVLRLSPSK
jgi:aldose sugar dehydrogenase